MKNLSRSRNVSGPLAIVKFTGELYQYYPPQELGMTNYNIIVIHIPPS